MARAWEEEAERDRRASEGKPRPWVAPLMIGGATVIAVSLVIGACVLTRRTPPQAEIGAGDAAPNDLRPAMKFEPPVPADEHLAELNSSELARAYKLNPAKILSATRGRRLKITTVEVDSITRGVGKKYLLNCGYNSGEYEFHGGTGVPRRDHYTVECSESFAADIDTTQSYTFTVVMLDGVLGQMYLRID